MTASDVLSRLNHVKKGSTGWTARCPAHEDRENSLSVKDGEKGVLLNCFAGCSSEAIAGALGLTMHDLFYDFQLINEKRVSSRTNGTSPAPAIHHVYRDEQGTILYRIVRPVTRKPDEPKCLPEHPDSKGRWTKGLPEKRRRVLYRLPELIAAPANAIIHLTEGEKDADNLAILGFIVTTNAFGADAWKPEFNQFLRDRFVVLHEHNDQSGRDRCQNIAPQLVRIGATVLLLRLPGLGESEDVSDWLARGGTKEQLEAIIDKTSPWTPPPPIDPDELDRELAALQASTRALTDWTWRRTGDDFTFHFPDKSRFQIRGVHERAGGLSARVEIDHPAYGRLDFTPKYDFSSRPQHKDMLAILGKKAAGLSWEHHLDEITYTIDREFLRGHPATALSEVEDRTIQLALSPSILLDEPNMIVGFRGDGKSFSAQTVAVSWITGKAIIDRMRPHPSLCGQPVMYLDKETQDYIVKRRIANIANVLKADAKEVCRLVYYKKMECRLSLMAAELRREIAQKGIKTILIDSWKSACGTNTSGDPSDAVNEAFDALRTLECTSLIVAHPPKPQPGNGNDRPLSVYGSSFSENYTRSLIELKRLGDRKDLEMKVVLNQIKENDLFSCPPIGLNYIREIERDKNGNEFPRLVAIKPHDLTVEPDAQINDYGKLKAVLLRARGRQVSTAELANITGIGQGAIRARLSDHVDEVGSAIDPHGRKGSKVWFLIDTRHNDPGEDRYE